MKSFKDKFDKFAQATEEKLNEVKTAIQQKLNENNEKKPESDEDRPDNSADLLQGWTLLGGDRNTRNKNVEFDASDLQSTDVEQSASKEGAPHDTGDAGDAHAEQHGAGEPAKSADDSLENIPLAAEYDNDHENNNDSSRNNSLNYEKVRIADTTKSGSSRSLRVSTPFVDSPSKSPENIGYFFLLSNTIIWNILSLVDAYDLCQLSRTSAHFFKLATNEFLWERLYIKVFRKDNTKVDKALWYEQLQHGGYRSLFGTKLCEENMAKTLRSLHNQSEHNAVEWICKPLVSVSNFFSSTEAKLVMFGLDGSGKTSILYKLVRGEQVKTEHTVGFNHEQVDHKGYKFDIWDLEHKPANQFEFWKTYFPRTNGVIFVVDGTAPELLPQARACMELFISAPQLADLPLLVYVNKRDVVESLSTLQVLVGLNLHYLCNKSGWHIQPCSTTKTDYSIFQGLDWFCEISKK
eukprot:Phypoly_transcript_02628.p1 GENE.Phypoly_transcript_02628~~Phypoly_transcript_02628.p1  ORF type:complete len:464 (-),score=87.96 Phypoly_transcript_02628:328-1719(-)